jgi:ATP-dependent DNA helicase DinG
VSTPLDEVFADGGYLSRVRSDYQRRAGQVQMAEAVEAGISGTAADRVVGERLTTFVQAPTGTGKSIALLVPAIFHAVHNAKRAIYVTANIALQEQLIMKDLPSLREALPWRFDFALAKGINNYLCLRTFEKNAGETSFLGLGDAEADKQWPKVVQWAKTTALGDFSELPFELHQKVRLKIATTSDDCIGKKCKQYDQCHAIRARRAMQKASIVVTNYHLFFADLQIRINKGQGVLPAHDVVILDELHASADIARDFLGFRLTIGMIRWVMRPLAGMGKDRFPGISPKLAARANLEAERFFDKLAIYEKSDKYRARLRQPDSVDPSQLISVLIEAATTLVSAATLHAYSVEDTQEIQNCADRCLKFSAQLRAAATLDHPGEWVYFIEPSGNQVALVGKPIDVAPLLRAHLFNGTKSVIGASATLTVGGSFDYVREDLGADKATMVTVPSPFDWATNALLVVPAGLPEPTDPSFPGAAAEAVVELVRAARGRTLVLSTSTKNLHRFRDRLLEEKFPFRIFAQGDAPRTELLRQFRDDVSSVLVGTSSFWEGVDVPGESCSLVIIDRIPFETPNDPVLDAITARTRNWFMTYMVPRAAIDFAQGAGRLLRTTTDRGVVALLDRRIVSKPYGRIFQRALPEGVRLSRDVADVAEFLKP